jgi:hypothetical protein
MAYINRLSDINNKLDLLNEQTSNLFNKTSNINENIDTIRITDTNINTNLTTLNTNILEINAKMDTLLSIISPTQSINQNCYLGSHFPSVLNTVYNNQLLLSNFRILTDYPSVFFIVSNDNENISSGSYLQKVRIYGITNEYKETNEIVNLNGTTIVSTTNSYYCIYKLEPYSGTIKNNSYIRCYYSYLLNSSEYKMDSAYYGRENDKYYYNNPFTMVPSGKKYILKNIQVSSNTKYDIKLIKFIYGNNGSHPEFVYSICNSENFNQHFGSDGLLILNEKEVFIAYCNIGSDVNLNLTWYSYSL